MVPGYSKLLFLFHLKSSSKSSLLESGNEVFLCHQNSSLQVHIKAPVPRRRFSYIHVYHVGPHPQSQGFSYLFTIINRISHWTEAIPILQTAAEECAKVLLHSLIPVFGVPAVITSDRGVQFRS